MLEIILLKQVVVVCGVCVCVFTVLGQFLCPSVATPALVLCHCFANNERAGWFANCKFQLCVIDVVTTVPVAINMLLYPFLLYPIISARHMSSTYLMIFNLRSGRKLQRN